MRHQWPPAKTQSGEAAEADVAAADPRHCTMHSWQHSELRPTVLHTAEREEVDGIAALPDRVIFGGLQPAC